MEQGQFFTRISVIHSSFFVVNQVCANSSRLAISFASLLCWHSNIVVSQFCSWTSVLIATIFPLTSFIYLSSVLILLHSSIFISCFYSIGAIWTVHFTPLEYFVHFILLYDPNPWKTGDYLGLTNKKGDNLNVIHSSCRLLNNTYAQKIVAV